MRIAILLGFSFFISKAWTSDDQKKVTLNVSFPSKIIDLDPVNSWSFYQQLVMGMVYGSLTKINYDGEVVGHFAKAWYVSHDQKEYTFILNENIHCHDGSILTSDDVAFSISRHFDKKLNSGFRPLLLRAFGGSVEFKKNGNINNFNIINKFKFKITLPSPYIPFISMVSLTGLSVVKKDNPSIGCGPYIPRFDEESKVILSRFKKYFKGQRRWKNIYVHQDFTTEQVLRRFKNGELDFAIGSHLTMLKKNNEYSILPLKLLSYNHLLFNPSRSKKIPRVMRIRISNWVKSIAWAPEVLSPFEAPSKQLLPKGILPPDKGNISNESADLPIDSIKRSYKKPLKFIFVERHFSPQFKKKITKEIERLKLPILIDWILGPNYIKHLDAKKYDLISYPFITGFYDPDGYYFDLSRYTGDEKDKTTLDEMKKKIETVRHLSDKEQRVNEYAKIFKKIQDLYFLVPLYNTSLAILSKNKIKLPPTSFRNSLELSEVRLGE